jgi:hypothetical protein
VLVVNPEDIARSNKQVTTKTDKVSYTAVPICKIPKKLAILKLV